MSKLALKVCSRDQKCGLFNPSCERTIEYAAHSIWQPLFFFLHHHPGHRGVGVASIVVLHIASKECKTQNVEDVIFLAAQNTIDSIHIVSSKLDSVQAILQSLHRVSSVNEMFSRIGLCVSLKTFSGQWACWIGGLNSFLDNLSELMVNM
jgi:hypothetical protein